jgi:phytoene dehydrogenase-like protein
MYDVAIIGAGIAGMATAARLQARDLKTIVLESHGHPGGCAGFFRRKGFSLDAGVTTLVDFEPGANCLRASACHLWKVNNFPATSRGCPIVW